MTEEEKVNKVKEEIKKNQKGVTEKRARKQAEEIIESTRRYDEGKKGL